MRHHGQFAFMAKLLVISALFLLLSVDFPLQWHSLDDGFKLIAPSFTAMAAQKEEQKSDFLEQEAGIAAYANVGQMIDLGQIREALKDVLKVETPPEIEEYLVGELVLPELWKIVPDDLRSLTELVHPHVYIDQKGWIVAYYTREESVSKIMWWPDYRGGPIQTTTLQQAICKVYEALRLVCGPAQYYDFEHPQANRIMIIVEFNNEGRKDSFYLTLPQGLTLYDASWSFYKAVRSCCASAWMGIDDQGLQGAGAGDGDWGLAYGNLMPYLRTGVRHTLWVENQGGDWAFGAFVLVYRD